MTVQVSLHKLINPHSAWHSLPETEIKAPVLQELVSMVSCKTESQMEIKSGQPLSGWNPRQISRHHIYEQGWGPTHLDFLMKKKCFGGRS